MKFTYLIDGFSGRKLLYPCGHRKWLAVAGGGMGRLGLNMYASDDKKLRSGPCVLPQEEELVRHTKELDELGFEITITDLRMLAYHVACAHSIN